VLLRLAGVEQKAGLVASQAQLKSADAVLAEAESRYRRASELVGRQLLSRADYDIARASRDSALAARDAAKAAVQQAAQSVEYTVVRAPYAGIVSARRVEPGEAVVPGQALFGVYAPGALRVAVQVPLSVASSLRESLRASLTDASGKTVDAGPVTVYPSADAQSHSVTVRVALTAKAGISAEPGATLKVQFPGLRDGAVMHAVPAGAIVQRGEVSAVYVMAGDSVSLRQLRLGDRHDASVDVIAGLSPGDKVVLDPVAAVQWLTGHRAGGKADRAPHE
jgi:RND family efflux transporter MFP subunit